MDKYNKHRFQKLAGLITENQEIGVKDLSNKWDNLEDEMKWELLCSAVPPRKAEELIQLKWDDIPEEVQLNIDWSVESAGQEVDEAKSSIKEGESIFKDIDDDLMYGEASNEDQIKYLESIIQYCQKLIKEIKETDI